MDDLLKTVVVQFPLLAVFIAYTLLMLKRVDKQEEKHEATFKNLLGDYKTLTTSITDVIKDNSVVVKENTKVMGENTYRLRELTDQGEEKK